MPTAEDLVFIADLIDAGRVKPVIDATYPMSEAREAFRYVEEEHPRGKVVILM